MCAINFEYPSHLGDALADAADDLALGVAIGECPDTSVYPADGHKRVSSGVALRAKQRVRKYCFVRVWSYAKQRDKGWHRLRGSHLLSVVLLDVPADEVIALRQAEGVEAVGELWVGLDLLSKDVNRGVHVKQETIDGVLDAGVSGGNTDRVCADLGASGLQGAQGRGGPKRRVRKVSLLSQR